jgi:dynein heavy chain
MQFEEKQISLNKNWGIFVTMNPGYIGRSELPENLKSLFRPICMTIPDSVCIVENILKSDGI